MTDKTLKDTLEVVTILAPQTVQPAYIAARACYSKKAIDDIYIPTEEAMVGWLDAKVLGVGHWSILENLQFMFGIMGVSRSLSHQLVRHRIATYAQSSQRYVDGSNFTYITPKELLMSPIAMCAFNQAMEQARDAYTIIRQELLADHPTWTNEQANEIARSVLPNACSTQLTMSVNAHQLIHMSRKRLCLAAQGEIQDLFKAIHEQVQIHCPLVAKYMGKPCNFGKCPENHRCSKLGK